MVIQEVFTEIEKFENDEIFYDLFAEYIAADKKLLEEFYKCNAEEVEDDFKADSELLKAIQNFYTRNS